MLCLKNNITHGNYYYRLFIGKKQKHIVYLKEWNFNTAHAHNFSNGLFLYKQKQNKNILLYSLFDKRI